ncbi:MAG TPA: radical SAM protein [Candidatus Omnitrophota bacterium]|nr:radical SAM protein [Candidatus Omnitrophota bacterium]
MIISWNTTKACNLKCEHCYRDAGGRETGELSTEEGKELLSEIAKAGFRIVILSGGEPLLRPDIFELIAHAASVGMRPVLGTNGVLFTREIIGRLKKAGLARAGISLDSTDRKIHDAFRKQQGAWEATVAAMKLCHQEGLDFQVHTTVTRRNDKEVLRITDFVEGLGAKAHHIFFLVPTGRGKEISDVFIGAAQIEEVLRAVLEKQKTTRMELKPVCAPQFVPLARSLGLTLRFQRGCLAGTSYCCILPNGDVHPCPYLPLKAGNVRQEKFSLLWKDSQIFKRLRTLDYGGTCAGCAQKNSCGGCRARAFHALGDYMAQDPECIFHRSEPAHDQPIR